jgi:hypothetical protein
VKEGPLDMFSDTVSANRDDIDYAPLFVHSTLSTFFARLYVSSNTVKFSLWLSRVDGGRREVLEVKTGLWGAIQKEDNQQFIR